MNFDRNRTYRGISHYLDSTTFFDVRERVESSTLVENYEKGNIGEGDFLAELKSLFPSLSDKVNNELLMEIWGNIFWLNKDMFSTLKNLKKNGIKLFLLSNTNITHIDYIKKDYSDLLDMFEYKFYSFVSKSLKPDETIFLDAFDEIKKRYPRIKPEEILYVDDIQEYVQQAIDTIGVNGFVFRSYPHFIFWLRRCGLYVD